MKQNSLFPDMAKMVGVAVFVLSLVGVFIKLMLAVVPVSELCTCEGIEDADCECYEGSGSPAEVGVEQYHDEIGFASEEDGFDAPSEGSAPVKFETPAVEEGSVAPEDDDWSIEDWSIKDSPYYGSGEGSSEGSGEGSGWTPRATPASDM